MRPYHALHWVYHVIWYLHPLDHTLQDSRITHSAKIIISPLLPTPFMSSWQTPNALSPHNDNHIMSMSDALSTGRIEMSPVIWVKCHNAHCHLMLCQVGNHHRWTPWGQDTKWWDTLPQNSSWFKPINEHLRVARLSLNLTGGMADMLPCNLSNLKAIYKFHFKIFLFL